MGCGSSKLGSVEDSLHVVKKREKRQLKNLNKGDGGQREYMYKPPATHPIFQQQQQQQQQEQQQKQQQEQQEAGGTCAPTVDGSAHTFTGLSAASGE